jgi:hypothetical protein
MSRATGVAIITGAGLDAALNGVEVIIDAATGPSPEEQAATEFFVTAAHNLQEAGVRAAQFHEFVAQLLAWAYRARWPTSRRCGRRSSRPGPWPTWSPTSPPRRAGPTFADWLDQQ